MTTVSNLMSVYIAYGLDASKPATPAVGIGNASYFYATDTTTLYCWTGSSWTSISGGGGGGSTYSNPILIATAPDTSSFATAGNILATATNITVTEVSATFTPGGSSQTFNVLICTVDGSDNITGTVAASTTTYTSVGSTAVTKAFSFAGAALTAGTVYLIALVRTDGSGTSQVNLFSISGSNGALTAFPHDIATINSRHTSGAVYRAVYAQNSTTPTSVSLGAEASGTYMLTLKWH